MGTLLGYFAGGATVDAAPRVSVAELHEGVG
jgi:hypothetical protein